MSTPLTSLAIEREQDVVAARQRARQIAALSGFDPQEQTRIATAVSEIARNAFVYAGGARIEFLIEGRTPPQVLAVKVADRGPGIRNLDEVLGGRYRSPTGMGLGLVGAKRLMDRFEIQTGPEGTTVWMRKLLPARAPLIAAESVARITAQLAADRLDSPLAEIRHQNQELLRTLDELRRRQEELARVNRELQDTNRGVVALYAELEERADHLRRADEVKTRFLSNMTHEFRTPVNSILALTRLLLDRTDGELTPEQERQIGFARRAAEELSELVNDLLDLAKAAAGKIEIRPAEFRVDELFGALRGMLRPLLVAPTVHLVFDEPAGVPPLFTDESKVSQILRNFISNALKFTERGEVRVSAALSEDGTQAVFSVADTGIGIEPENIERIFEEFSQIDHPIQRRVRGTGLGLPLSRRLAELLGGRVQVQSRPGLGSTFSLVVPVTFAPAAAQGEPPAMRRLEPGAIPVLTVDDRPEDRLIYDRLLRGSRYQAIPAATLRQAREAVEQVRPAAVVLDVVMGAEDGWKFLVELKSRIATAGVPVIMATGIEDQPKAYSLGADAYGLKPLTREWLLGTLDRLVEPPGGPTALIIDDDEAVRYTLAHCIRRAGWRTREAPSGDAGLESLRASLPQAVFLDLTMPGMDGMAVLEAIRSEGPISAVPVIVSSSRELDHDELGRLRSAGAEWLPKSAVSAAEVGRLLARLRPAKM